jgi:hypothetical protein
MFDLLHLIQDKDSRKNLGDKSGAPEMEKATIKAHNNPKCTG